MASILIEDIWKEYRLGTIGGGTLVSDLQSLYSRIRGKDDPNSKIDLLGESRVTRIEEKRFFALRGINLEINQGDIVGIIGKNGAGKSTLLKILAQITKPTRGSIKAKGRISCLLEVGTGFHPELTGGENVYLNGAIHGMSRREVKKKFDQIVEFSGVSDFVDTPVKRYSSGMHVRLAFAVAAHLDPDILVVDEVLAVGDADFQSKCLGKMKEVSKEGRTVLFVSHQMNAVENLCNRGVIIDEGLVTFQSDSISTVIRNHVLGDPSESKVVPVWENLDGSYQSAYFFPKNLSLLDENRQPARSAVRKDEDLYVEIQFDVAVEEPRLIVGIELRDENARTVFSSTHTDSQGTDPTRIGAGRQTLRVCIPRHFLNEGIYLVKLRASLFKKVWLVNPATDSIEFSFQVQGGLSDSPYWHKRRDGPVAPILNWELS
ncbi:MAG: polysaccharide ABC transporter ATP-binding protein [Verrucomicrobiota bacterium]